MIFQSAPTCNAAIPGSKKDLKSSQIAGIGPSVYIPASYCMQGTYQRRAQSILRVFLCDAGKLRDVTLQNAFDSTTFSGRYRHMNIRALRPYLNYWHAPPLKEPKAKRAKVRKTTPIQSRTAGAAFCLHEERAESTGLPKPVSRASNLSYWEAWAVKLSSSATAVVAI
ncbi:hypothetical protein C8J56DRAFT_909069 [Mycena floridula]|nr:hypothetical protein C8J56DRAFT_909069 [Mycena floridula]